MKAINPYLNFDGNTREAMTFYSKALDAQLDIQSYKDAGMDKPGAGDRVLHARLSWKGAATGTMSGGATVLMASDNPPGQPWNPGDNVWLSVDCETTDEQDRVFNAISEGGKVIMPLADQFWGARFGMVKDKFGLGWIFNCELKK